MNLFKNMNSKANDIVALANAELVSPSTVNDPVFAQELMGQTLAFKLHDGVIVSPVDGVLEVVFKTGHAFGVRMKNGQGIIVHIGINTIEMNGQGFEILAKQGQKVKAGQEIVKVDLDLVEKMGYDSVTMLVITEPVDENKKEKFIDFGEVQRGQVINVKEE